MAESCASKYAACLVNPFTAAPGACLPASVLPLRTVKATARSSRVCFDNTTDDCVFAGSFVGVKDNLAFWWASLPGASGGTDFTTLAGTLAKSDLFVDNLPFTYVQAVNSPYRIVGYGFRIKMGSLFNRTSNQSAIATVLSLPGHPNLGTISPNTLFAHPDAVRSVIQTGETIEFFFDGPATMGELEFSRNIGATGGLSAGDSPQFIGMVNCGPAAFWVCEIVAHVEYLGGGLGSSLDFYAPGTAVLVQQLVAGNYRGLPPRLLNNQGGVAAGRPQPTAAAAALARPSQGATVPQDVVAHSQNLAIQTGMDPTPGPNPENQINVNYHTVQPRF